MLLAQAQIRHVSTILHEGKVILVATDGDRRLWYSVKQDGFEDSYLDAPPSERTGWEDWRPLELPDEPKDDASVVAFERERLADAARPGFQVLRSLYRTRDASAAAPVQLVSAFACLYVFRQSQGGTLLVDRFVLDGISNRLVPRLEVRFRRSRQRHWPSAAVKVGGESLRGVDTLDFRDTADELFREPTLELALVENLQHGWFTVVLVPTNEHDRHAWHIFAHDRSSGRIEHVALRASDDGLFDPQDQLLLEPASASDATAVPRVIPGITRRTLELSGVTVTGGPTATRYDLQQERVVDNGRARQLLRADTRLMLAIPTDRGVATISFALAADGALSEINREGATRIVRGAERELRATSCRRGEPRSVEVERCSTGAAVRGLEGAQVLDREAVRRADQGGPAATDGGIGRVIVDYRNRGRRARRADHDRRSHTGDYPDVIMRFARRGNACFLACEDPSERARGRATRRCARPASAG